MKSKKYVDFSLKLGKLVASNLEERYTPKNLC